MLKALRKGAHQLGLALADFNSGQVLGDAVSSESDSKKW
jgi:hypothetical protein